MGRFTSVASLALVLSCLAGCGASAPQESDGKSSSHEPFSSANATLLDLDFDGELTTANAASTTTLIKSQLFFTVGQLNDKSSLARLSKLAISNVTTASIGGGLYRVRYHAKLPVAWGSKTNIPHSISFVLPRRADSAGLAAFATHHEDVCQEHDGSIVSAANFWFHYRPSASGCALTATDTVTTVATAKISVKNTTGKYPELHRVWEDGALRVVAVFGKYEAGATSQDDPGIAAYDQFIAAATAAIPNAATTPASLPAGPGAAAPDVTIEGALDDGRSVTVTALLVNDLKSEGASFDKRYSELTPGADIVIYDGHAGLGANVASLAHRGAWFPGKYQILFVNGCDTFAYQDDTLATTRAALNPDDKSGTKYLDTITNAMPAYFSSMPSASMTLVRAMWSDPRPYDEMFQDVDPAQVVVVDGEDDNVFTPAHAGANVVLSGDGTVSYKQMQSFETDVLPAGKYAFEMTPEASAAGGDADLRVRVGSAPDGTQTYKCPSYRYNSNERCVVTLTAPSRVFATATGDKSSQASSYLVHAFSL